MITSIKAFKNSLNENLLIPRRSKDERNVRLLQNNYKKLCDNETITVESNLIIDSSYDFPSSFNLDTIKVKVINADVRIYLNYIPKWLQRVIINGRFHCNENQLTSLEYCPAIINGSFNCSNNCLTSLKGCPTTVKGAFYCFGNELTSLEYCPTVVTNTFDCSSNKLTSLEHCPKIVNAEFQCGHNRLTSLEGCPTIVKYNFECYHNTKEFTKDEVKAVCHVHGRIFV